MSEAKFCRECGAELVKIESPGFSEVTGERNYSMVCPSGKCEHTGIWHDYGRKPGLFNWLMSHQHCKKCGQDCWEL